MLIKYRKQGSATHALPIDSGVMFQKFHEVAALPTVVHVVCSSAGEEPCADHEQFYYTIIELGC